jgi:hypothetical protein
MAKILLALAALTLAILFVTEAPAAQTVPPGAPNSAVPMPTGLTNPQPMASPKKCQQKPNGCKKKKKKKKNKKNKAANASPRPMQTSPMGPAPRMSPPMTTPHPVLSPLPGAPSTPVAPSPAP